MVDAGFFNPFSSNFGGSSEPANVTSGIQIQFQDDVVRKYVKYETDETTTGLDKSRIIITDYDMWMEMGSLQNKGRTYGTLTEVTE